MAKQTKKSAVKKKTPLTHSASIFSYSKLSDEFVAKTRALEAALGKEVWFVAQGVGSREWYARIDFTLYDRFVRQKKLLPQVKVAGKTPIALLIHSNGGIAEPAYRIASLIRRRCSGFTAVVPRLAKSAATLMALGADEILLGETGELGPLDAQFFDFNVEEDWVSALDEVQAVEQLEQSAIDSAWRMLVYLHERTQKKVNNLMPHALTFAAEVTKPLFEKIDAVRYSRQSRVLQEAQDYAERLLRPKFTPEEAKAIAHDLVRKYPTHGFPIDIEEAASVGTIPDTGRAVGLQVKKPAQDVSELLDWFYDHLPKMAVIGKITSSPGK